MLRKVVYAVALSLVINAFGAMSAPAQTKPDAGKIALPTYFFYAKPKTATRKSIPVAELTLCHDSGFILHPIIEKFKERLGGNQDRQLEKDACDVAAIHVSEADALPGRYDTEAQAKKTLQGRFPGFAIYRVAGEEQIELFTMPDAGGFIAIANPQFASRQTLEKSELRGCGDGPLRAAFRPNPRVWQSWSQNSINAEYLSTQKNNKKQLDLANPLNYGCDVFVVTPEDYKKFTSFYGTSYPLFDISPESPTLTRHK